jgi:hypothetical protein
MARSITLGDISVTFDQPIDFQSLADWIEVLKQC